MPRLPRVTAAELLRALRRDGWEVERQRRSHRLLTHPMKTGRVVVAVHPGEVLKPKTLLSALEQAGLTVEELRDIL